MELNLAAAGNKAAKQTVSVSEIVFGSEFNEALVHQVVVAYMANGRAGTKAQKSRSEVRGGGRKPWRQKGTGRARSGTINSPIWRSGGVTFAAKPRDYSQKINKKMYRLSMRGILSELNRQGRLLIVESLEVAEPKTKLLVAQLEQLGIKTGLIVTDSVDEKLYLAARNLPKVGVCDAASLNPVSLIANDKVILTVPALKQIEGLLK